MEVVMDGAGELVRGPTLLLIGDSDPDSILGTLAGFPTSGSSHTAGSSVPRFSCSMSMDSSSSSDSPSVPDPDPSASSSSLKSSSILFLRDTEAATTSSLFEIFFSPSLSLMKATMRSAMNCKQFWRAFSLS